MNVSFLLASGFSIPAGYPKVWEIGEILFNLQVNGICTHSDGTAWFRKGFLEHLKTSPSEEFTIAGERPHDWAHREGVHALVAVIKYYNRINGERDYERFYDLLMRFRNMEPSLIEDPIFIEEYSALGLHANPEKQGESNSLFQSLYAADYIFNQLLEQILKPKKASFLPLSCYHNFRQLLDKYASSNTFYIHTLNHDEYVEELFSGTDGIGSVIDYSDGFDELGSPYYGRLEQKSGLDLNVRIPQYTGNYKHPIHLYKLHGSLNYYDFGVQPEDKGVYEPNMICKPPTIAPYHLLREVKINNEYQYRNDISHIHPLYLTGTKTKQLWYQHYFFEGLLKKFIANLSNSDLLVIIGYGFSDEGINNLISPYMQNTDKETIIIDVSEKNNINFIKPEMMHLGGLQAFDFAKLESKLDKPAPPTDWRHLLVED